jgi:nucleotide-binding universal stress UspA family protein
MRLNPTSVIQLPHAMNLLCGTDFSPNATDATQVAAGLAQQFRDTLTLVHASVPPADDGVAPEVWSTVEAALRSQLESQATPLRDSGLDVETRLESGSPVDVLTRLAEPGRCRMIVLSSIGHVALTRLLLGSTADRVAESAAVPTLVVRRTIAFADWRKGRRPLRLFVAADFSAASDAALQFARNWSHAGPIELIIGHVADPGREQERRSAGSAVAADPASPHTALERDLQERASLFVGGSPFTLAFEWSSRDTAGELIELAKKHRADVIITGSHQIHGVRRLWHHSVSRALLADAAINVAVVPGSASDQSGPIPH